jgi:ammonium transporter Rh
MGFLDFIADVVIGAVIGFFVAGPWGAIAGAISTIGFAILKEKQEKLQKIIDACGVTNLHGIPGIFGGLSAIVVVEGLDASSQLKAIGVTIVVAILGGLITGKIVSLFGKPENIYNDENEFEDAED